MTVIKEIEKRLIEDSLPLKILGEYAQKEKPAISKTISGLHLWWARRPLTMSRAVIAACLLPAPKSNRERNELHNLLINSCNLDAGQPNIDSQKKYYVMNSDLLTLTRILNKKNSISDIKLLDPFAGGGSIPFEALRLGLSVAASDLNPISFLIREAGLSLIPKTSLEKVQHPITATQVLKVTDIEERAKKWCNRIIKRVYVHLKDVYSDDVLIYLWSKTCHCKTCGKTIPLHSFQYVDKKKSEKYGIVLKTNENSFDFSIDRVDKNNPPSPKLRDRKGVTCPFCKTRTTSLKDVKEEGKKIGLGYYPIGKICLKEDGNKEYQSMSKDDLEKEKTASQMLKTQLSNPDFVKFVPNEPSPPKEALGNAVVLYGHETFNKFFSHRQLLFFSTTAKIINDAYPEILKEVKDESSAKTILLITAFILNDITRRNSLFSAWDTSRNTIGQIFGTAAFKMTWDFAESNPFTPGSGSWASAQKTTLKAFRNCIIPTISNFNNFIMSATNLNFKDEEFDLVITDPPYYDYIGYADLSDFFYVWLKRTVGRFFPEVFKTVLTPKSKELILSKKPGQDILSLEKGLLEAWTEINRVLKSDGLLVVMFTHKSTEAWEKLFSTLYKAGFYATATWPVLSEHSTKMLQNRANVNTTLNIVCRKHSASQQSIGTFKNIKVELTKKIRQKCKDFWNLDMYGSDFFVAAIGPAIEVFAKFKKVIRTSGEEVTIGELIDFTREIVSQVVLEKLLAETASTLDHRSRVYVLWRWAYLTAITSADDLITFLKGVGGEREELENEMRIVVEGSKVGFLGPFEREKNLNWNNIDKWDLDIPLIDQLHTTCLLREKGSFEDYQNYLMFLGVLSQTHHPFWKLTRSLVEILQPLQTSGKNKTRKGSKELEAYRKILENIPSLYIEKKKPVELDKFLKNGDKKK
ncbi:MAG: DUF1156 domain-containing protein [Candidatus Hodarchaeota archaeon]